MASPAAITTIRTTESSKFISHEVFIAGTTMPAPAINANLVNKIAFFHELILATHPAAGRQK